MHHSSLTFPILDKEIGISLALVVVAAVVRILPHVLRLLFMNSIVFVFVLVLFVKHEAVVESSNQGENHKKEDEAYGDSSQGIVTLVGQGVFLGLAHQQNYLQPHENSQFQHLNNPVEEVATESGIQHHKHVQGLGYQQQKQLCDGGVGQGSYDDCVPPEFPEAVNIVELLCVGDLAVVPDISVDKSEEDLVVAVGVVDGEGDVFFFLAHPEQVEEGVYCGKNEGNNSCCKAGTSEQGLFFGSAGGIGELEGAGEDQGEELVEDQGVEVEVGSPMEGHLEVPLYIAGQSALSCYAFFSNEEHNEEVGHESCKHHSDVVNISEKVDIGSVLVEVCIGAVVEL